MPTRRLTHPETLARLSRSRDFLADRYNEPVLLADAARTAYLSKFHFQRLFQTTFGETPHEFLTRRRMERACALLASDETPVTDICLAVGYNSPGSFSTRFHQLHGCSPTEYRARFRRVFAIPWPGMHFRIPECFLRFYGVETAIFEKRA